MEQKQEKTQRGRRFFTTAVEFINIIFFYFDTRFWRRLPVDCCQWRFGAVLIDRVHGWAAWFENGILPAPPILSTSTTVKVCSTAAVSPQTALHSSLFYTASVLCLPVSPRLNPSFQFSLFGPCWTFSSRENKSRLWKIPTPWWLIGLDNSWDTLLKRHFQNVHLTSVHVWMGYGAQVKIKTLNEWMQFCLC